MRCKPIMLLIFMLGTLALPALASGTDYCEKAHLTDEQWIDLVTGGLIILIVAILIFNLPALISIGAGGWGAYKIISVLVTLAYYWLKCRFGGA